MGQRVENLFTTYEFTTDELRAAMVLPELNAQWIQTLLGETAIEKAALQYDVEAPQKVALQEAYLRGTIDILGYVLGLTQDRKKGLMEMLAQKESSQAAE